MICELRQKNKDLYSAEFDLVDANSFSLGFMNYRNKRGMSELSGKWSGTVFQTDILLTLEAQSVASSTKNNVYRPCEIIADGKPCGRIFQKNEKTGLFQSFSYHQMTFNEETYEIFPIGFGKAGIKNPVIYKGKQIAQIEKDPIVYDDLHTFKIYSIDDTSAFVSTLFSCYMYTVAFYKHGVKATKAKETNYSKTTNKTLLSKYNPNFKKENFIF